MSITIDPCVFFFLDSLSCHQARYLVFCQFLSHLLPFPCVAGTVPREGFGSSVIMPFPSVKWLWHFLYSVGPHPVSSFQIYTFVVSRAFIAGAASQAGEADSSRAPGLTSSLQGSVNVHRGAVLLVPQWQCISSFVFYIFVHKTLIFLFTTRKFLFQTKTFWN